MKTHGLIVTPLIAFALAGCSRTQVTDKWMRPDYEPKPAKKTLVVGIAQSADVREAFENAVVGELVGRDHVAEASLMVLPPNAFEMDRSKVRAMVLEMGFDSAVVMALVDRVYLPKNPPGGYSAQTFGSLYTNYPTNFGYVDGTVPDEGTTVYVLEARYYDFAASGVVWRTQTETREPKNVDSFAREFAERIVRRLADDRIITD